MRWRWVWGMVLTGLALSQVTAVAAQPPAPIPITEFWYLLRTPLAQIDALTDESPADQRQTLAAIADELDQITAVSLPDGRVIPAHPTYLISQLRAEAVTEEPDLARLEALFTSQISALADWPPAQLDSLDEAALAEILARPEFQYETPEPNAWQRFWQDVRRRVFEFLARLLPEGQTTIPVGDLVTLLGAIALVGVLIYALRGLFGNFAAESALSADGDGRGEILTAEAALQRAQQLSSGGDYRSAVRYLYLSSLLLLEERGLLRYDRSMTNHEYVRSIRNHPRLAAVLEDVIDVFDRVWYGFQMLEADEYEAYARQVDTLKQQREEK